MVVSFFSPFGVCLPLCIGPQHASGVSLRNIQSCKTGTYLLTSWWFNLIYKHQIVFLFDYSTIHPLGLDSYRFLASTLLTFWCVKSVLIKGGQYLEALAHIKSISFDKTGTLTEGHFGIVDIQAFRGSEMEVLRMVASLELHSTHPLGPAIVGSAAARGISAW